MKVHHIVLLSAVGVASAGALSVSVFDSREGQCLSPADAAEEKTLAPREQIPQQEVASALFELVGGRGGKSLADHSLHDRIADDLQRRQMIIDRYRSEHPELEGMDDDALMEAFSQWLVSVTPKASEAEIRAYYEQHPDRFKPRSYRAVRAVIEHRLNIEKRMAATFAYASGAPLPP